MSSSRRNRGTDTWRWGQEWKWIKRMAVVANNWTSIHRFEIIIKIEILCNKWRSNKIRPIFQIKGATRVYPGISPGFDSSFRFKTRAELSEQRKWLFNLLVLFLLLLFGFFSWCSVELECSYNLSSSLSHIERDLVVKPPALASPSNPFLLFSMLLWLWILSSFKVAELVFGVHWEWVCFKCFSFSRGQGSRNYWDDGQFRFRACWLFNGRLLLFLWGQKGAEMKIRDRWVLISVL